MVWWYMIYYINHMREEKLCFVQIAEQRTRMMHYSVETVEHA